jgi:DnaK suppressor protein
VTKKPVVKHAPPPARKVAAPAKKTVIKKTVINKTVIKKTAPPAKKAPPPKIVVKAAATKAPPAKPVVAAKKTVAPAVKVAPANKAAPAAVRAPVAAPAPAPKPVIARRKGPLDKFLLEQRELLQEERATYVRQADELKAEADQLATEMEPGESEFGEEGGEGGNLSVERELDLRLSAQARTAVIEIDQALAKIEAGTYGMCEKCGQPIPKARLKALPAAPLCVACKSGGLSRR